MTGVALAVGGWASFAVAAIAAWLTRHALSARGEAVARACHEVRGPLAAARLGLELSASTASAPTARLRAIEAELRRAAVALDDLEGVRLQEAGRELVDVETWLRDSVEAWEPVAQALGVEVKLRWPGPSAQVWGHQARLAQVTGNLIVNALEHGGGPVEVRGIVDWGRVRIEVTDEGPGLPAAVADRLRQDGARSRWPRGSAAQSCGRGRGLGIACSVVTAHGGRIWPALSDRGARLVVDLPLATG
ncbi:MAG: sensor histidine kinase [Solirubrobacteraceae bacterium]